MLSINPISASFTMPVYEANGLKIVFQFDSNEKRTDGSSNYIDIRVVASATNNATPVDAFEFQAAVPKSCHLQLLPPSGTSIRFGGPPVTQLLKLTTPSKVGRTYFRPLTVQHNAKL